ncbi:UNVERIFIED_CONTAM: hypothetical protein Sradi_0048600 [Sesamum radiatum]|uniref:Uncharacterized protein n=1 Tax=Sesamum radiatum TaxID=300843 RepID=A0AAW2WHH1_SESRA
MAYAAVASLRQSLDDILHPDSNLILHDKKKLKFSPGKIELLARFPRKGSRDRLSI